MKISSMLIVLYLCGSVLAAPAPTTRPLSNTRYSIRQVSLQMHGEGFPIADIRQLVARRAAELFNLVGLSAQEASASVTCDRFQEFNNGSESFTLTIKLPPNAKPAAKEMMLELVASLPKLIAPVRTKTAREALDQAKKDHAELVQTKKNAATQEADLEAKARDLAGQINVTAESVSAAAAHLEEEQQKIELDLLGKTARREAMEKQVALQSDLIERKVQSDPIAVELQKAVDARESALDFTKKQVAAGVATAKDDTDAIAAVAEVRAKLLQRKRDAAIEAGGDTLVNFNRELLTLSIDQTELRARLDFIKMRLDRLSAAMGVLRRLSVLRNEAVDAENELNTSSVRGVNYTEDMLEHAGEVDVNVSYKEDQETAPVVNPDE